MAHLASMEIAAGTRLGPYEILSPLGAGGMGEVFKARDTRLERSVAIKVLPAEYARDPQFRLRLEREAKTISQLNHPHICTLYDVGHENGVDYLVMELIEGEALADRLARGPLPVEQVLRLGVQIAGALDKAHRQGIVHRDLKPANIMITKSGAKLLDFGLAKPSAEAALAFGHSSLTQQKPITEQGTILGTFQYMAPEQLEGADADPRTDIFSFGAVLYEMATGRRAFEGKTRTSLIAAIVSSEPPPISHVQPLTPPALEHVVQKCLAKDPEERWQSAHDVAAELRWISETGSAAGVPAPILARRKSRERLLWTAALLAALGAGAWGALRFAPDPPKPGYRFAVQTLTPDVTGSLTSGPAALSPDGSMVAFVGRDRKTNKLGVWIHRLSEGTATPVKGSEGLGLGYFTPDSSELILTDGKRIALVPVAGGAPRVVYEGEGINYPRTTADGTLLFRQRDGGFYTAGRNGGAAKPVTTLDKSRYEITHSWPVILPDQKHFLFLANRRDPKSPGFNHDLYVGSIDGAPARRIAEVPSFVQVARGHLFFVRAGTLLAAPFDETSFQMTGDPLPVVDNVHYFRPTGVAAFQVAGDGTIAYIARAEGLHLTWLDHEGKKLGVVGEPEPFQGSMRLAADGTRVYISVDDREGVARRWVYGLTRSSRTPLSTNWAWESSQVVTPDGSTVYYASDRAELPDIYRQRLDGSGNEELVISGPGDQFPNDISPDGRNLLYTTAGGATGADLMALPLPGSEKPFAVARSAAYDGAGRFSPDGKWVAYLSNLSGRHLVYVKRFREEGLPQEVSSTLSQNPRWSADGKYLYYATDETHTLMRAARLPDGSFDEPQPLFTLQERIRSFELHPDGRRILALLASDEQVTRPVNIITGWEPPRK